jgi:outer membrane murein-binding lipoprotein Lpp
MKTLAVAVAVASCILSGCASTQGQDASTSMTADHYGSYGRFADSPGH